jgi:hypothetical protein
MENIFLLFALIFLLIYAVLMSIIYFSSKHNYFEDFSDIYDDIQQNN